MTYYNYISLYFFGGDLNFLSPLNEVFYLDVSRPFNIASPPWNDLTVNEGIPIKIFYTTALLRVTNNEKPFIYLVDTLKMTYKLQISIHLFHLFISLNQM